jgi:hypothetical protein
VTTQEIRADGFEPDETVEMLLSGDTPTAICKFMGQALIDYDEALQRLNPDMVVLGDRFETFWSDYMFEISEGKFSDLRSKFPTAKFAKTRALPKAFTEQCHQTHKRSTISLLKHLRGLFLHIIFPILLWGSTHSSTRSLSASMKR